MERRGLPTAVWIVLFLAVSAWLGAWLFRGTEEKSDTESVLPERAESICLSGIALRREEAVFFDLSSVFSVQSGERVPANSSISRLSDGSEFSFPSSCVFFSECDGYEYLSPEDGENITVSALRELLALPPEKTADCRIVTDYVWYYAALADDISGLSLGERYTLCFEDIQGNAPALLVSNSEPESGKYALLFRLTVGGDYLKLRKTTATLCP